MKFHVSNFTPKQCVCPNLPGEAHGEAPVIEPGVPMADWQAEWMRQDCSCCMHLRAGGNWQHCDKGCIRTAFPAHVEEEWSLLMQCVEEIPIVFSTPMGGMTDIRLKLSTTEYLNWVERLLRLPRRRRQPLLATLRGLLATYEEWRRVKGGFGLTKDEWALLVRARDGVVDEDAESRGN